MTRKGDWIQTYSGKLYWPLDPKPEEVDIIDIAHVLSLLCRYGGHCERFFSVAEHSVNVSYVVAREFALEGLLHDATEGYIQDLVRPVKYQIPEYRRIEELNRVVIASKFNLPEDQSPEVKVADNRMLITEALQIMKAAPQAWTTIGEPYPIKIVGHSPRTAEKMFLDRFHELTA